jgi:hypothetical protein
MIDRFHRPLLLASALCFVVLGLPAPVAAQQGNTGFRGGFYVGAMYSSLSDPAFRGPGGGEQFGISQSKGVPTFMAGYDVGRGPVGAGLRVSYLTASFESFATPEMPGSTRMVNYSNPRYSTFVTDLVVHWAPARSRIVSINGFLGLGAGMRTYTVSNSSLWSGETSTTEFEYSYGLGARVTPVRHVCLFAEIRLIPGDKISDLNFLYSRGGWNYYEVTGSRTAHYTKVFAAGLAYHF